MDTFLQRAEDILGVATAAHSADLVILLDRQGAIRMLDPAGWSLPALQTHYGASSLYKVERREQTVRVEGWERGQRCLLQRDSRIQRLSDLPGFSVLPASSSIPALLPAA